MATGVSQNQFVVLRFCFSVRNPSHSRGGAARPDVCRLRFNATLYSSTKVVEAVDHRWTIAVPIYRNAHVLLISVGVQVLPVTYSSLIQSKAGKALRTFKDHPDAGVRKQAKAVISHWKTSLVVRGEVGRDGCRTRSLLLFILCFFADVDGLVISRAKWC